MSASNWAICPKCVDEAERTLEARQDAMVEAYGKVSAEQYELLREEAKGEVIPGDFQTFREDYEIYGAKDGTIKVDYSGHCTVCGCGTDFQHEYQFYPVPKS